MNKKTWYFAAVLVIIAMLIVGCSGSAATPNPESTEKSESSVSENKEPARPSNAGGPGQAVSLTGDAAKGKDLFAGTCAACHGPEGTKGIDNAGSDDGSVPTLNPIDETIKNSDYKTFATNVDLFVEHGSTPSGKSPAVSMPSFGDSKTLAPQQIADVSAYVISLNQK